jgi:hypothetical protein
MREGLVGRLASAADKNLEWHHHRSEQRMTGLLAVCADLVFGQLSNLGQLLLSLLGIILFHHGNHGRAAAQENSWGTRMEETMNAQK